MESIAEKLGMSKDTVSHQVFSSAARSVFKHEFGVNDVRTMWELSKGARAAYDSGQTVEDFVLSKVA